MNGAQLHLAINHLPVFGMLIGTLILAYGWATRRAPQRDTALAVLALTALSALPAYYTGEPAEDVVEHRPGVTRSAIHEHEEAGEFALVLALAAGAAAAGCFYVSRREGLRVRYERPATTVVLLLSVLSSATLLRTAHLGGLVRHDELRPRGAASGEGDR